MAKSNQDIAALMHHIADFLAFEPGNRFRIAAYRRAAEIIEKYPTSLTKLYHEDGLEALDAIPGIGEGIAKKIAEYIETGELDYYQRLAQKYPPIIHDLLKIPSIGPKIAYMIATDLKLKNLHDFPKIMSSPNAKKIFTDLERKKYITSYHKFTKLGDRLRYADAEQIALPILEILKSAPSVQSADVVGSFRRRSDTVGDLDFIAASSSPKKVIEYLLQQPFIEKIIAKGDTKLSIYAVQGAEIDFEILPPADYGTLLQHFTGSAAHNVALRGYAKTLGYSLSEHGIKTPDGVKHFAEEKQVYKYLQLEYIPPELRENRGEIEAAKNNQLPHLIELADINGDLHIHSNYSDGRDKIHDIAKAASGLGYDYIAICDHSLSALDLQARQKEIHDAERHFPHLKIFSGLEVNIRPDGRLDVSDNILASLDVVIASIHSSFDAPEAENTMRLIEAIKNPHVDIIGHPSGRKINERLPIEVDWTKIFQAVSKHHKILEINSSRSRLDLTDNLVKLSLEYDVQFVINSDAHTTDHLKYITYGIYVARRGWLSAHNVINTMPLKAFEKYSKEK